MPVKNPSVDSHKVIMHKSVLFGVVLVLSLQVSSVKAVCCNKNLPRAPSAQPQSQPQPQPSLQQQPLQSSAQYQQRQIHHPQTHLHPPIQNLNQNRKVDVVKYAHDYPDSNITNRRLMNENREQLDDPRDYDNLRLEYFKFKLLSNLGMSLKDPEQMEPRIDYDLRQQLTAITAANDERGKSELKSRTKRSLTCNQLKANKDACCLESFYVNFTDIGWDKWIIYPEGYIANYCKGACDLSHARYYHSTLLSKFSSIIGLCCSPKQMSPLLMLYIDDTNRVQQRHLPDMTVESCDCA